MMTRSVSMPPLVALVVSMLGVAAAPAASADADPLFLADETLIVQISGPLRALARDRAAEPEYRPGTLSYTEADGTERQFEVGLRPRGHSRRDHATCTFPPLRVNVKKKAVAGSLFDGQDKLKLVVHCRRSPRHDRYVYKEYLAYRLLNQLTDASFRVRALDIEWIDTTRDNRSERRFGFFIEDDDRLAARLQLQVAEPERIDPDRLAADHATMMELFQFMIGNTDFSFVSGPEGDECCHNAVLLQDADGRYWPMPYDFDITGFVDPPYAVVNDDLPIANVRRRLFRGFCRDRTILEHALEQFRQVRPALTDVLRRETPLPQSEREAALGYIDDFYRLIDDPDALRRRVVEDCR